jgi:hypothetical protein
LSRLWRAARIRCAVDDAKRRRAIAVDRGVADTAHERVAREARRERATQRLGLGARCATAGEEDEEPRAETGDVVGSRDAREAGPEAGELTLKRLDV